MNWLTSSRSPRTRSFCDWRTSDGEAESGTRSEADRARLGEQPALGRHHPRLHGRRRAASAPAAALRLRASIDTDDRHAKRAAERLWQLLQDEPYVNALGALTGNQA